MCSGFACAVHLRYGKPKATIVENDRAMGRPTIGVGVFSYAVVALVPVGCE